MEAVIAASDELARLAAGAIQKLWRSRPDAVLGLATGSSPLPIPACPTAHRGRSVLRRRHSVHPR